MKARIGFVIFLYRLLQWIALPAVLLYLSVRALRQPGYGLRERLGGAPAGSSRLRTQPRGVWLHAVSVGEVLSAVRLISELRASHPERPIYVSVGTVAGRELARMRLRDLTDGVFYVPLDYAWCVRRVLQRLRPVLVIILETEIWPNLWRETVKTGAGLLVVNGRLSDRAWPRYRRLSWWFEPMLNLPQGVLAQDETSLARYVELGAGRTTFAGNLKYDLSGSEAPPPTVVTALLAGIHSRKVWIAASTMPAADAEDIDEDDVVIDAFRQVAREVPDLLLILVPRKPERFEGAAAKLHAAGIRYRRRSQMLGQDTLELPGVLLVDSMGELGALFQLADAVFMGGTLARRGGHNILEPAFAAKPVIVGPHMENFAGVVAQFRRHKAVMEIAGPAELAAAVISLLTAGDDGMGKRGQAVAEAGRGATLHAVAEVNALAEACEPVVAAPLPLRMAATVWSLGAAAHRLAYERGLLGVERLPRPVVSVGGIASGGTGKTPLAVWLAAELKSRGLQPAFLTRGYRRQGGEAVLVVPVGGGATVQQTGDEAQILIRGGIGAVGIAANRAAAAKKLLAVGLPADVFVLDDGFQHHRLARDFDLVAIDALDPFAGGRALPAGRLREPLSSLGRASAVVLTRTERGRNYESVCRLVHEQNPNVPIFLAWNIEAGWFDGSGRRVEISGPAMAFCGLGNPASFWKSLDRLGVPLVHQWEFADHHRYSAGDVSQMVTMAREQGVRYLLTTEKDWMNLPPGAEELTAGAEILWLKLDTEVERGAELIDLVQLATRRG